MDQAIYGISGRRSWLSAVSLQAPVLSLYLQDGEARTWPTEQRSTQPGFLSELEEVVGTVRWMSFQFPSGL
jgi:hypothetical protein